MKKLDRLTRAIADLTTAYRRRKATGRPIRHLLPRCRRLSAAWLDERNNEHASQ